MNKDFQIVVNSLPNSSNLASVIAACRAGALGVVDLEFVTDPINMQQLITAMDERVDTAFGVKVTGTENELFARLSTSPPAHLQVIVFAAPFTSSLVAAASALHQAGFAVWVHATDSVSLRLAETAEVDGIIAKGHEAGGRIEDATTFVLLQWLLTNAQLPVWAHGGIGLHTAAACAAAGAAGVVLDSQLALTRESALPEAVKTALLRHDASATLCLGETLGLTYRIYYRPGLAIIDELQQIEMRLAGDKRPRAAVLAEWRSLVAERVGWDSLERQVLPVGQDCAFAAALAQRYRTVAGVIGAVRQAVSRHCDSASRLLPLQENSRFAQAHGIRYPILQGPMTRVSDVPEFALRVAEGGALPFVALALLRKQEVSTLLYNTRQQLGTLPWGVGILGFVPTELREQQLEAILAMPPRFALLAGGRPDQAQRLEAAGILTYLHVPSPGLLTMFLEQGARHFVFEGRECGGHVGPRTSFVLWSQMIDVFLDALAGAADASQYRVVFAGGIHDARSAQMVSVLAAPLAERGVRLGVLIGSAYLFTEEAVAAGAIEPGFQQEALRCEQTVLLETGPGHATRCVPTAYAQSFRKEKLRLSRKQHSAEVIRGKLEDLNLGRLRIAAKGLARNPDAGPNGQQTDKLIKLTAEQQLSQGMFMIGQIATLRDRVTSIATLHKEITTDSSALLEQWQARPGHATPASQAADIAIIGLACHLPKAPNLQRYWDNILTKVDAIVEIPKERFDWELFYDPDPNVRDKIYSKWGGFIDDIAFDPMDFGMPPASLRSIEPAQILTLAVVQAALRDAGYADRPFDRERTSVILGAGGGAADLGLGYGGRSFIPRLEQLPQFRGETPKILEAFNGVLPEWTEDSFAGILTNVEAGRVANRFDLGGMNCTVDAACASSLAALSVAVRELETQNSDMVITGGVDTMQNPFTYLCFSKTRALSPRGRCRTFDQSADGIAISEGLGIVILKRLADAERDGDRIYGVIKGIGSSSDGKDKGLTAPRAEGQARALHRAYATAGVSPASITLVEAHGTGTAAGDRAEIDALSKVFVEHQAAPQACAVGSVKSMIGHTKCTAGVAGLIKVALALHHKVLPPTLHVEQPNLPEPGPSPFYVNTEARYWARKQAQQARRAGVSAFGFGGTNFHVVLEEYTDTGVTAKDATLTQWPQEVLFWRAPGRADLLPVLQAWQDTCSTNPQLRLLDLAYTAWLQFREALDADQGPGTVLAIVASSLADLLGKLQRAHSQLSDPACGELNDPNGIYCTATPLQRTGKLAFLFTGQGAQYPHMLNDVVLQFQTLRNCLDQANQCLADRLPQALSDYIYPPSCFSAEEQALRQAALTQTQIAQPAIGAVSLGYFQLLEALGIRPDLAAGHSYGEYVALAAAGVLAPPDLFRLSEARGRFVAEQSRTRPGAMAAVLAAADQVGTALHGLQEIVIANSNSPQQTVISGSESGIQEALERCAAQGLSAKRIPVTSAFHSPLLAPVQEPLGEFFASLHWQSPQFCVYSNTTAAPHSALGTDIAAQLLDHLVQPVQFVAEIEAMYQAGARIFVEIGPQKILSQLVEQILEQRPKLIVASDQRGRSALLQLLHLLAQLAAHAVPMALDHLFDGRQAERLDLQRLRSEPLAAKYSATTWLVNGGRARPAHAAPQAPALAQQARRPAAQPMASTLQIPTPTVQDHGLPATVHALVNASPPSIAEPARQVPAAVRRPAPGGGSGHAGLRSAQTSSQVMLQFQQLMSQFLEVQKGVMLNYLQEAEADAPARSTAVPIPEPDLRLAVATLAPATSRPLALKTQSDAGSVPVSAYAPAPMPVDAPALPMTESVAAPDPVATTVELTAGLLAIVSERTGYPADMLGLDLDLEADLGIDSIKRVEILGNFQQRFAPGAGTAGGLLEQLSQARTLRAIVTDVAAAMAAPAAAAPLAAATAASADGATVAAKPKGLTAEQLSADLLAIVSERTGYPADMLGLDLDLEADLGIDSIKRVEILGNFRHRYADLNGSASGIMETLTLARTLRAIVDTVLRMNGTQLPDAQAAASNAATMEPATGQQTPDWTSVLLNIVSERTGYPGDMLGLDLDLEADLGIDSIKRVEILGNFRQALTQQAALPEGSLEQLMGMRTLRGVLDAIADKQPTPAATTAAPTPSQTAMTAQVAAAAAEALPPEPPVQRYTVTLLDAPLRRRAIPGGLAGVVLITDDERGVAGVLRKRLQNAECRVLLLQAAMAFAALDDDCFALDLSAPEQVAQLVATVNAKHGPVTGILHLAALRECPAFTDFDQATWQARLRGETRALYCLAHAAAADLQASARQGHAFLQVATAMGGDFLLGEAHGPADIFPGQGALVGLAKTLAMEWPGVRLKAVDFDPQATPERIASCLIDELHAADSEVEVGYLGERRIRPGIQPSTLPAAAPVHISIDESSVLLITGGARGITAQVALQFARHRPTLILVGRTRLPRLAEDASTRDLSDPRELKASLLNTLRQAGEVTPAELERAYARLLAEREIRANLAAMRAAGAKVRYHALDVRDAQAFGTLIATLGQEFGRIDGVIHGAGIIEDKLIQDKTPESFARVLSTKVDSAFLLSSTLDPETLQFLVFFTSIAGRFGNRGQGDYAAANQVLSKLAQYLDRRWPARVVAIDWGPWDAPGMVSAGVRKQFAERGVALLPPDLGVRMLNAELQYGNKGTAEVVIGGFTELPEAVTTTPEVRPLLRGARMQRNRKQVEMVHSIDTATDRYLRDHEIDGKPVLPLAMATEYVAQTAAHFWPEKQLASVDRLFVLRGIPLGKGRKELQIVGIPRNGAADTLYVDFEIRSTGPQQQVHYRASVELCERLPEPPSFVPSQRFGPPPPLPTAALYEQWLFHGPLFQGIRKIEEIAEPGMKAKLITGPASEWFADRELQAGDWLIDPLMLDSGLQLLLVWGRHHWGMTMLPSRFERFRRFQNERAEAVDCEVRFRPNTGGQTIHADMYFRNPDGGLIAILEDIEGNCSKELNRIVRSRQAPLADPA